MPKKRPLLFTLTSEVFLHAVNLMSEVASSDESKRILIRIVKGAVIFSATGAKMFISYAAPAETFEERTLLLSLDDLMLVRSGLKLHASLQKQVPVEFFFSKRKGGDEIVIKTKTLYANDVKVLQTKKLSLRSLKMSPAIPPMPKEGRFKITTKAFIEALAFTTPVVSKSVQNPIYNGCRIGATGNKLYAYATDGVCLSVYNAEKTSETDFDCLVPYKFCVKALKIIHPLNDVVVVRTKSNFTIKTGSLIFGTVLINATFPNFSKIFEKETVRILLDRRIILDSLAGIAPVVHTDAWKKITMFIYKDSVEIFSKGFSASDIPTTIKSLVPFKEFTIDFNVQLMIKTIKSLPSDMIILCINNPNRVVKVVTHFSDERDKEEFLGTFTTFITPLNK
jgi:DNA polymerase III sliding clamp (beta) subunit (PCNA family)